MEARLGWCRFREKLTHHPPRGRGLQFQSLDADAPLQSFATCRRRFLVKEREGSEVNFVLFTWKAKNKIDTKPTDKVPPNLLIASKESVPDSQPRRSHYTWILNSPCRIAMNEPQCSFFRSRAEGCSLQRGEQKDEPAFGDSFSSTWTV